jgi:hypothetical protein
MRTLVVMTGMGGATSHDDGRTSSVRQVIGLDVGLDVASPWTVTAGPCQSLWSTGQPHGTRRTRKAPE